MPLQTNQILNLLFSILPPFTDCWYRENANLRRTERATIYRGQIYSRTTSVLFLHLWVSPASCVDLRSSLFSDVTQRRLVVGYRRCWRDSQSHPQVSSSPRNPNGTASPLTIGPTGTSKSSVNNHWSTLGNNAEERRSYWHRDEVTNSLTCRSAAIRLSCTL
jgi:hypothetical protein